MNQTWHQNTTLTLDDAFRLVEGPAGYYYMVQRTPEERRERLLASTRARRNELRVELMSIQQQLDALDEQIEDHEVERDDE